MMIDVIWPGILAAHAADLSQAIGWQGADYSSASFRTTLNGDKLVGIPWYTDAGLLYYRSDLLEKHGFENHRRPGPSSRRWHPPSRTPSAPTTRLRGFVWQGAAYEGLTCDALEWQVSNGGGGIIEED